jgi:hypothetical protein
MQMRVMTESLAPGMEHRKESDLGAKMLRVSGDSAQRLTGSPEWQRWVAVR